MKRIAYVLLAALMLMLPSMASGKRKVVLIMVDGYRWQELYRGADSTLMGDVLARICACSGMNESQSRAAIAASFMVSADNAHALSRPTTGAPLPKSGAGRSCLSHGST